MAMCAVAGLQIGCEAATTTDTGSPDDVSHGVPVVVTDCQTATYALQDASVVVKNRAGKVENRCVNTNRSFNPTKCMLRLDELSDARQDVTAAESVVRARCTTL